MKKFKKLVISHMEESDVLSAKFLRVIYRFLWKKVKFFLVVRKKRRIAKDIQRIKGMASQANILSINISPKETIIETKNGNKFVWDPENYNSLFTIPDTGVFEQKETELLSKIIKKRRM